MNAEQHIEAGEALLAKSEDMSLGTSAPQAEALAAQAQAHFAAAQAKELKASLYYLAGSLVAVARESHNPHDPAKGPKVVERSA